MNNLMSIWAMLDTRRRILLAGATLAVFLGVLGLTRLASTPDLALLYAGLDEAAAGEVIAALDQRGVAYQVRAGAILVDAAQRDSLRMELAAEGLPATGVNGYELLDGLSGFGTTSQMFDAAYWRAKEGELARTILANPAIRSARVHIAQTPAQPFRQAEKPSASVFVTTAAGTLTAQQARALRHLVAAAVAGLQPADVAIIDSQGGLISDGEDMTSSEAIAGRETALRRNVERLLEARVGPGRAIVEVSLDLVTDREQISERRFDPQGRVAISTETQEKTGSSRDGSAEVTVASNLPEGDAAGGNTQSQSSESRERVNFEVSETQRELLREPGGIRRLSVAVLVDGIRTEAADGTAGWEARPEEELATLRDLVASAVGFDEARGDVITLKSLPFEAMSPPGTLAEAGLFGGIGPLDPMRLLQMAILSLVVLLLGLFVVRPLLRAKAAEPAYAPALPLSGPAREGELIEAEIDDLGALSPTLQILPGEARDLPDDPVARLRRLIGEREAESVEILRGWLEQREEKA